MKPGDLALDQVSMSSTRRDSLLGVLREAQLIRLLDLAADIEYMERLFQRLLVTIPVSDVHQYRGVPRFAAETDAHHIINAPGHEQATPDALSIPESSRELPLAHVLPARVHTLDDGDQ